MATAWVLTAAMPPTLGHANIVNFANCLPVDSVEVIQVTRVNEPMADERLGALKDHFLSNPRVVVRGLYIDSPGPETDDYWVEVLKSQGFRKGDYLVASEFWGDYIARGAGGTFVPYDYDREIHYTRATDVRATTLQEWSQILPNFQKALQRRVVIFGAESVGKTTLAKDLSASVPHAAYTIEFARPYLETVGGGLTVAKMETIVEGQAALQRSLDNLASTPPLIALDTDLYSTLGYWEFWDPSSVPLELSDLAWQLRGDFYLLVPSNIPFEEDVLRYGGTEREKSDGYWEEVLEKNGLPYQTLESRSRSERVDEANTIIGGLLPDIDFERLDNLS